MAFQGITGTSFTRRTLLRTGFVGAAGLTLPRLTAAESQRAVDSPPARARSCIVVFMSGGPAHQDLWDLKPAAPVEYRGDFRPISSSLPGVAVCEHLPLVARQIHRVALIRSVHHSVTDHRDGAYYVLTGRSPINESTPSDGCPNAPLSPRGEVTRCARGGWVAGASSGGSHQKTTAGLDCRRWTVPGRPLTDGMSGGHDPFFAESFDGLNPSALRRAFDLSREPMAVRERYGVPAHDGLAKSVLECGESGGLQLGQSLLLARRLVESGVRLVTVRAGRGMDWDTHRDHFPRLKNSLLPCFDRGFATLLADLAGRDMLRDTMVVAMGEFGRAPRLGQFTSRAGAGPGGRDHWPHCYTVVMAGGGIPEGALFGASDPLAAYPARDPVTPEDITATIELLLGMAPATSVGDSRLPASAGTPILPLVG